MQEAIVVLQILPVEIHELVLTLELPPGAAPLERRVVVIRLVSFAKISCAAETQVAHKQRPVGMGGRIYGQCTTTGLTFFTE